MTQHISRASFHHYLWCSYYRYFIELLCYLTKYSVNTCGITLGNLLTILTSWSIELSHGETQSLVSGNFPFQPFPVHLQVISPCLPSGQGLVTNSPTLIRGQKTPRLSVIWQNFEFLGVVLTGASIDRKIFSDIDY